MMAEHRKIVQADRHESAALSAGLPFWLLWAQVITAWSLRAVSNIFTGNGISGLQLRGGALYVKDCRNTAVLAVTEANMDLRNNTYTSNAALE
jgi:hypothetical protein